MKQASFYKSTVAKEVLGIIGIGSAGAISWTRLSSLLFNIEFHTLVLDGEKEMYAEVSAAKRSKVK